MMFDTRMLMGFIHRRARHIGAALLAVGLVIAAQPVLANSSAHLLIGHNEIGRTQHVQIGVNKSIIIDLQTKATRSPFFPERSSARVWTRPSASDRENSGAGVPGFRKKVEGTSAMGEEGWIGERGTNRRRGQIFSRVALTR